MAHTEFNAKCFLVDRRFQSTLLIPLNARLNLAISSELEDQEDALITESDEVEDDTL